MTQRIDKWLWFVRIFKTRSIATEYIRKGRVSVNGSLVKPAREVQEGDTVIVRKPPVAYTFRIKGLPKSRLGAKLVSDYMENLTPEEELQKLDPNFMVFNVHRDPGTGRPTKKDRRMLDEMIDDWFDWDED